MIYLYRSVKKLSFCCVSGGCKHSVAFLTWLHRRSEEPSTTSVECYWKKSALSSVGTTVKFIKAADMGKADSSGNVAVDQDFLDIVVDYSKEVGRNNSVLTKYFKEPSPVEKLSLHYLLQTYLETDGNVDASKFEQYCSQTMTEENCIAASLQTSNQADSPLWHELRYSRVTASKAYAAVHCKTGGVLVETVLGASKLKDSAAMKRGRVLEKQVLATVENKFKIRVKTCGLRLNNMHPFVGASPDAVCDEFVVEVKCPAKVDSFKKYLTKNNEVTARYKAQIQLQMFFYKKNKALFCVAHPDYEQTKDVTTVFVNYDQEYCDDILSKCAEFWRKFIFPVLIN